MVLLSNLENAQLTSLFKFLCFHLVPTSYEMDPILHSYS
nr:MAG TPA_asm: hypothetical protein [Caudoviricetes sp.]